MSALSYTFDWRRREHADVVSLLLREIFATGFRRVLKWMVIVILMLEGLYVVVMVALGDVRSVLVIIALLAVVAPIAAGFYRITGRIRAWQVSRLDPNVGHPVTHVIDDSGYHVVTRTVTVDLNWGGLHKVRETTDYFLIYYSRHYAYYLPKRVLGTEESEEVVRVSIQQRLPASIVYQRD